MARITIKDVNLALGVTQTYDIINAIRNSSSDSFTNYVPLANAENVVQVGQGILINQTIQNEFISSLVDRIGLVVVRTVLLKNPLKKFKKGAMTLGRTIEEIFVDIVKAKKYDPFAAESTVFARSIPNVKTLFHERNRQDFYDQTIQDESLKTAFTSWDNLGSFISGIINAIYNSAEVDEFEYMKLLIDNYYSKGLFTIIPVVAPNTETAAKEFVKKVRATVGRMTLTNGSRDYNSLAVRTKSDISDLHLIIDADLQAEIDVDVLAKAFNMDKTDFVANVTIIDNFSSTGLEAVLIDKEFFMVFDNLMKLETIRNPKGLYWNYFFHVWQTLSVSRFANAVAFVSGSIAPVTQVIVDPTILAIKAGSSFEFTAYVRSNDGLDHTVVWTVTAATGSTITSGTAINSDGVLTLASGQVGQLSVKATVSYTDLGADNAAGGSGANADTTKTVVGESIVTIV